MEDDEFDLMKIGSADPKVFARLAVACDTYPILKVAMENFYGREAMSRMYLNTLQNHRRKTAARQNLAQSSTWAPRATTRPAVRVVTENDSQFFPYLTEKQAEDLIGGPITIDEREEDEVATIEDEIKFVSPHQTGVYDVFCADGSFRECLVIVNPMFIKSRPDRELCLVIDWKRRKHIYAKSMAVLCVKGSYKDEWFNRLPADAFKPGSRMRDAESEDPSSDRYLYRPHRVFVTSGGQATVPLRVESLGNGLWAIDDYNDEPEEHRDRTYDVNENVNFSIGLVQMLHQQGKTPEREIAKVIGRLPKRCVCSPMLAGTKITVRDDKLIR